MQYKKHYGLNLIQIYQHIISYTHLNAWKYSYNAHEMQCMKFLRSNLQNPSQKFCKNLFGFEKPQNFQKSQKLILKNMKCMNMRDLDTYQVNNNLILGKNTLRKSLEWMGFGRWKDMDKSREIEENEDRIALTLYIGVQ